MKRLLLLVITMLLVITGCGKEKEAKTLDIFKKEVKDSKAYHLTGKMDIYNNEDTFKYKVEVNYLKKDYYKVYLLNETNDHEQIILKNEEGVFVVTPSLNKSFKFQSDWPNNSSQSYLLGPIVNDLEKDDEIITESKDGFTIITSEVHYPNNEELLYQKLYFNKKHELTKLEVYDDNDIVKIKVEFGPINYKAKSSASDYSLKNLIKEDCNAEVETPTGSLDEIIYPLYIPSNTYLKSKETVAVNDGERAILTFAGEKNFVIVEESSRANKEFEIIPIYGEPMMLSDTVAAISANSLSWTSNNIDYYIASSDLNTKDLLTIASSLNNNGAYVGK